MTTSNKESEWFWVCVYDRATCWPLVLERLPDFQAGIARLVGRAKEYAGHSNVEVEGYTGPDGLAYWEELLGHDLSEVQIAEPSGAGEPRQDQSSRTAEEQAVDEEDEDLPPLIRGMKRGEAFFIRPVGRDGFRFQFPSYRRRR